jgi:hypothetical protein
LHGVKLEFFQASTPLQKEILTHATPTPYKKSLLQILDIRSIAKLKLIALLLRNKSRDLFDFKVMLQKNILTKEEILYLSSKTKHIDNLASLYTFIEHKTKPKDDESVYLDENKPINLSFNEIKEETLIVLNKMMEK